MKRYQIVGRQDAEVMLQEAFPECTLGDYITSGAQGSVYLCTSPTGQEVVKFMDLSKAVLASAGRPDPLLREAMSAGAENEIRLLGRLAGRSQHTVQLIAEAHDQNRYVVRLQMLTPLGEYLKIARRKASMAQIVLQLASDLAQGLLDLRAIGYVHRDVKPENVCVLVTDQTAGFMLCDFGSASPLNEAAAFGSKTAPYAPPEADAPAKLTDRYDVYSLGVLMEQLLGREPCPQALTTLIKACKAPVPEDRPSLGQVQKTLGLLMQAAPKAAPAKPRSKEELHSLKDALTLWSMKGPAAQPVLLAFSNSSALSQGQRTFLHAVIAAQPEGRLYALRLGTAEGYLPSMHYYGLALCCQAKRCRDPQQARKLKAAGMQWLELAAAKKFYPSKAALNALRGQPYPADYAKLQAIALRAAL